MKDTRLCWLNIQKLSVVKKLSVVRKPATSSTRSGRRIYWATNDAFFDDTILILTATLAIMYTRTNSCFCNYVYIFWQLCMLILIVTWEIMYIKVSAKNDRHFLRRVYPNNPRLFTAAFILSILEKTPICTASCFFPNMYIYFTYLFH